MGEADCNEELSIAECGLRNADWGMRIGECAGLIAGGM